MTINLSANLSPVYSIMSYSLVIRRGGGGGYVGGASDFMQVTRLLSARSSHDRRQKVT